MRSNLDKLLNQPISLSESYYDFTKGNADQETLEEFLDLILNDKWQELERGEREDSDIRFFDSFLLALEKINRRPLNFDQILSKIFENQKENSYYIDDTIMMFDIILKSSFFSYKDRQSVHRFLIDLVSNYLNQQDSFWYLTPAQSVSGWSVTSNDILDSLWGNSPFFLSKKNDLLEYNIYVDQVLKNFNFDSFVLYFSWLESPFFSKTPKFLLPLMNENISLILGSFSIDQLVEASKLSKKVLNCFHFERKMPFSNKVDKMIQKEFNLRKLPRD